MLPRGPGPQRDVVAERRAVLWRLGADALCWFETVRPELAQMFVVLVLKGACCRNVGG
jgi:hypothetical protein